MENDRKIKLEAIRAGEKVIKSLKDAQKCLSKCQEKGILDVLGPLSLSTSKKNAMLEDAKKSIKKARGDLNVFSDMISGLLPNSEFPGLLSKIFNNAHSFEKDNIDRFSRRVNEGLKTVESAVRKLKETV